MQENKQPTQQEGSGVAPETFFQPPWQVEVYKTMDGKLERIIQRNATNGTVFLQFYDPTKQYKTKSVFLNKDRSVGYEESYQYDDQGFLLETRRFNDKGEEIGIEDDLAVRSSIYNDARMLGLSPQEARANVAQIPNEHIGMHAERQIGQANTENPQ
jgi:hypothetical protein